MRIAIVRFVISVLAEVRFGSGRMGVSFILGV